MGVYLVFEEPLAPRRGVGPSPALRPSVYIRFRSVYRTSRGPCLGGRGHRRWNAGFPSFKPFKRWFPRLCRPAIVFRQIMSEHTPDIDESRLHINVEELTPSEWLLHFKMLVDVLRYRADQRVQEWSQRQLQLSYRSRHVDYGKVYSDRSKQIQDWFDGWKSLWDDVEYPKKLTRTIIENNLIYAIERMDTLEDVAARAFYLVSGPPLFFFRPKLTARRSSLNISQFSEMIWKRGEGQVFTDLLVGPGN